VISIPAESLCVVIGRGKAGEVCVRVRGACRRWDLEQQAPNPKPNEPNSFQDSTGGEEVSSAMAIPVPPTPRSREKKEHNMAVPVPPTPARSKTVTKKHSTL
jgi:hypothetical protein